MSRKKQEYDWINDPFDDKKQDPISKGMSTGSKVAVTIGLIVAVIIILVLIGFSFFGIMNVMTSI